VHCNIAIQGPPSNINGTTAAGATESSTPMNNTTSTTSGPSTVPLPHPPPGQSENQVRTYFERNPKQKKRFQIVEKFIQQSKASSTFYKETFFFFFE
jgi:hypothetical protein